MEHRDLLRAGEHRRARSRRRDEAGSGIRADKAFWVGLEVGGMMVLLMAFTRMLGLRIRVELILGTYFVDPGPAAWAIGIVLFVLLSGVVGIAYAAVFEYVAHRADGVTGVAVSLAHMVLSGALLATLPAIHPRVTEMLSSPGPYMAHLGVLGVVAFVLLHLTFGALVGGLYGQVRNPLIKRALV